MGRGRVEKTYGSIREEGVVLGRGGVDEGGGRRFRGCDGWWKRGIKRMEGVEAWLQGGGRRGVYCVGWLLREGQGWTN